VTGGGTADTVIVETATLSSFDLATTPGVENLTADGDADFTGSGNASDNIIVSGGGDDDLSGGAGDDLLVSHGGDDHLDGGWGADTMDGGDGDDTYVVDNAGDVVIEAQDNRTAGGGGIDTVIVDTTTLTSFNLDQTPGVENLTADGDADFTGNGSASDNIIVSGGGNDNLSGGAGDDALFSHGGSDHLDGGWGADTMTGGLGDDTYVVDSASDVVIEANDGGTDTVHTTLSTYSLSEHIENLSYDGDDDFEGHGNDGDNEITGGDGDDELWGDDYDDDGHHGHDNDPDLLDGASDSTDSATAIAALTAVLGDPQEILVFTDDSGSSSGSGCSSGSSGSQSGDNQPASIVLGSGRSDAIFGSSHGGDDILNAGRGNDTLVGGGGDDTMTGGLGNDTFVFRSGFGHDIIMDFHHGGGDYDRIYLARGMFDDLDDLEAHMEQVGDDVVLTVTPDDSITFNQTNKLNMSVHDQFVFF
jgi:Ca2+-binding RTX toxin-like protein